MRTEAERCHQAVRKLIEATHPECRVVEINEHTATRYERPLGEAHERVLAKLKMEFTVEACPLVSEHPGVRCDVVLADDDTLLIIRSEYIFGL